MKIADLIRLQASSDSVKKSKELFLQLHKLVGVKCVDVDGYFIKDKHDPSILHRVLWSQKEQQKELDSETIDNVS